ncbi:hypothetical protein BWR60_01525 [Inquilinus limosus]|uniref:Cyclophilin-like domain-containing protein n=2 Tax=Inquilinus limosus TaxID=171674 RepID=A0A211ZVJ7_9PROT|nr:hypothetical protein BWR60_01525 [Inquilinus limosus]
MLAAAAAVALATSGAATQSANAAPDSSADSPSRKLSGKKIEVHVGTKSFVVDLYDNPTADDLLQRLPLTLKSTNYPGYDEKIIRLEQPLSMQGAPPGDDPRIPEVGYYHPGQWIALYYGHIGYWQGKVPLGRIHASVSDIGAIPEDAPVRIVGLSTVRQQ